MNIKIERVAPDGLHKQVWTLRLMSPVYGSGPLELRLDVWAQYSRETRRHGWNQIGEAYERRLRTSIALFGRRLPAARVPFGDDVIAEARNAILSRLTVIGPEDPPEKRQRFYQEMEMSQ